MSVKKSILNQRINTNNMKELIKAVLKGDKKAQNEFYKICCEEMKLALSFYIRDNEQRKDVKQNILIKIFTNLHQYDHEKGAFGSWIFRIAFNESMKSHNLKTKRAERFMIDNDNSFNFDDYFFTKKSEFYEENESNFIDYELIKKVKNKILELKKGQKQAVTLYDIEGYSHEEIASILNVSINTSKSQVSRGRKRIAKLLNN
jgi:RNA polymerase sigma-70 factor (ECF subfamily)